MLDFIDAVVFKHRVPMDVLRAHVLPFVHAHPPADLLRVGDVKALALGQTNTRRSPLRSPPAPISL